MKKLIPLLAIILAVAMLFCGCENKDMGRINYNYKMEKIVSLDSYAVEVDSSTEIYKAYYDKKIKELLVGDIFEGAIETGDIANIDYVGKKDGKAFAGGTSQGYDLLIGSGSFIDGFESSLIGVTVGSTVDINLTFPEDYGEQSLAGQPVVFTVTVNFITRSFSELNEETAAICGYKSVDSVDNLAKEYAKETAAWDALCKKATVEKFPEKETDMIVDYLIYKMNVELNEQSGINIQLYLSYTGIKMDELRESARKSSDAQSMNTYFAISYRVIDMAGIKITNSLIDQKIKEYDLIEGEQVDRAYLEAMVVHKMAVELVGEKATIK